MISASNYENCNTEFYRKIDINSGQNNIECFPKLFPSFNYLENKKEFKTYKEKYVYYTKLYYEDVLSSLDPQEIYNELDYSILLSEEDINDFSHRHLVAAWFELFLNKRVNEIAIENHNIISYERNIIFREILENEIKSKIDMKNFNSLRALYLYNQGEKFEKMVSQYNSRCSHKLLRKAYDLKEDAKIIEKKYNRKRKK